MNRLVSCLVVGEIGVYSHWTIMHFLSGLVPHAIFVFLTSADHWISLYVLAMIACLFELVENEPGNGEWMWKFIGYTVVDHKPDTLKNSVSDVVFLLLGWLVSEVVFLLGAPLELGLSLLLGLALVLFVVFIYLFRVERSRWASRQSALPDPRATIVRASLP
jgi:hypothetical protein